MTKSLDNTVLDAPEAIIDNVTTIHICSAAPANHAGIAAVSLADVTVDSSDFTPGDGDVSGRKVTVSAQNGITVDSNGTATHIAGTDGATMLFLTECTSQVLTAGNTVNIPAFDIEFQDPT
jgi:hypothetical protein